MSCAVCGRAMADDQAAAAAPRWPGDRGGRDEHRQDGPQDHLRLDRKPAAPWAASSASRASSALRAISTPARSSSRCCASTRPERPVTNVVFMGMGEPLANYDEVLRAIRLLVHPLGVRLGARRITVSTAGVVPAMRRFADERLQVGLAVSLHAPNDALRSELMPINRRWPISCGARRGRLLRRAHEPARQLRVHADVGGQRYGRPCRRAGQAAAGAPVPRQLDTRSIPSEDLNLVAPSAERALAFERRLRDAGIAATIRVNRGRDILAACGQLRLAEKRVAPIALAVR